MKALLLGLALAQTQPGTAKVPAHHQVTKVSFGGDDVYSAGIRGPDGVIVTTREQPGFDSLILIRETFRREVLLSVSEVK